MELDMEIGEGQPQGCPFFLGGGRERRFWREYAAGLPPGGRPAAGRGCAKEKFLYYIVISGLTILNEVGDGDAVQVFVDDFVETLPERESFTASHSGTVGAAGL